MLVQVAVFQEVPSRYSIINIVSFIYFNVYHIEKYFR
jgi:hypothetical protein